MSTSTSHLGTVSRDGDGYRLEYERHIAHPPERVWAALTEPGEVAGWLAAMEVGDLAVGAELTLRWLNDGGTFAATITALEHGRMIEYAGEGLGRVRWEIAADGDGSVLRLAHVTGGDVTYLLPGWHTHLEHLDDALAGSPVEWATWARDHQPRLGELRADYAAAGALRDGFYDTTGERPTVRFLRLLDHPPERVWRAVTEPAELARWFPAGMEIDLRPGGAIKFSFADDGEVVELDEPRVFAFTWGADELRFDLEPAGAGCLLSFTHVLGDREMAAKTSAGWDVCLDRLARSLAGEDVQAPGGEPTPEWRAHYARYVEAGFPAGSPVPGD